jgi:hypothetical protein
LVGTVSVDFPVVSLFETSFFSSQPCLIKTELPATKAMLSPSHAVPTFGSWMLARGRARFWHVQFIFQTSENQHGTPEKIRLEKHVDTFDLNILDPFMAKLAQDVRVLTQRPRWAAHQPPSR